MLSALLPRQEMHVVCHSDCNIGGTLVEQSSCDDGPVRVTDIQTRHEHHLRLSLLCQIGILQQANHSNYMNPPSSSRVLPRLVWPHTHI
jgi:hypothetical protein